VTARNGLEIERKYVVRQAPDIAFLQALGARALSIEQTYLLPTEVAPVRRVRLVRAGGETRFVYTEKRLLRPGVREERERAIDEATAARLLSEADPERGTVRKTRWEIPHGRHVLELDVFEAPPGLVLLEVELDHPDEPVDMPGWLGPLTDVSDDATYFNVELARRVTPGSCRDGNAIEAKQ
jgi:adenylate cyclase